MDNVVHSPMTLTRRVGAVKPRRGRPPKNNAKASVRDPAGIGTLTRTKSLLRAALRVWELKQRIND